jgi:hypothetical protein
MCPDAIDHYHNEGAVIHVQPIASSDELVRGISYERAVRLSAEIGLLKVLKAGHLAMFLSFKTCLQTAS